MKKYILTFAMALLSLYTQAQQMPLPDPNSPNTLYIKYKKDLANTIMLTGPNEAQIRVYNNGIKDWAWTNSYLYISKDNRGYSIDEEFYTPNKEYFSYTSLSTYSNVWVTPEQLKAIWATKNAAGIYDYLKGFSHIYIIDLDAPQPKQPTKYKIIEVKPYYEWEHN